MTLQQLLAALAALQAQLRQDRLALRAASAEALHELRIDLRQLRSLLKPLEDLEGVTALLDGAQALAALSGPLRDTEVLREELRQWQRATPPANGFAEARLALAECPEMLTLTTTLDAFCTSLNWLDLPDNASLARRFRRARRRWQRQLHEAIATLPPPLAMETGEQTLHRHALRLLIKRLRYNLEWQSASRDATLLRALREAQERIGAWHDRYVWIDACRAQPAIADLMATWESELVFHADAADAALRRLRRVLR